MTTTYSRITNLQRIYNLVSLSPCFTFSPYIFLKIVEIFTIPALYLIELIQDCTSQGFMADIFRYIAWCEERTIFVTIDFLKDKTKYRSVNQCFLFSFYTINNFWRAKIIGVKKIKQILECWNFPLYFLSMRILKNCFFIHFHFTKTKSIYREILLL